MRRIGSSHVRSVTVAAVLGVLVLPATPGHAATPGNNGVIAWTHPTGFFTDAEVFAIRPDGTDKRQVTTNGQNDFNPDWSPDGRAIAFESSSSIDVDIWILDENGERNLTNDDRHANRYPSWSPDGSQLAFTRQNPLTLEGPIFTVRADGRGAKRVTSSDGMNTQPAWSPNGDVIVFVSDRSGNHDLWSVRPDGTGLTQITDTPNHQEGHPDWSPDGTRIAFDVCRSATYPCAGVTPNFEIVTSDPDGSNPVRLTNSLGIDTHPSWSPDGKKIAFHSSRAGFSHIWTMNANGAAPTQLTFEDFQGGVDPDWQPLP